jgi:hypothetical protein
MRMQKMLFLDAVNLLERHKDDGLHLTKEVEFVVKGRSYEVPAQCCAKVKGVIISFQKGEDGHAVNVKYRRGGRLRPARTVKSAIRAARRRWRMKIVSRWEESDSVEEAASLLEMRAERLVEEVGWLFGIGVHLKGMRRADFDPLAPSSN